jgi:hypothetical protein
MFVEGHEVGPDDEFTERGVGRSCADYSWNLYRLWCHRSYLYLREKVTLSVTDWRTGACRLISEMRLDDKFRRFEVVERANVAGVLVSNLGF